MIVLPPRLRSVTLIALIPVFIVIQTWLRMAPVPRLRQLHLRCARGIAERQIGSENIGLADLSKEREKEHRKAAKRPMPVRLT